MLKFSNKNERFSGPATAFSRNTLHYYSSKNPIALLAGFNKPKEDQL